MKHDFFSCIFQHLEILHSFYIPGLLSNLHTHKKIISKILLLHEEKLQTVLKILKIYKYLVFWIFRHGNINFINNIFFLLFYVCNTFDFWCTKYSMDECFSIYYCLMRHLIYLPLTTVLVVNTLQMVFIFSTSSVH